MSGRMNSRITLESIFKSQHDNPPEPLNPDYKPYISGLCDQVVKSMEADGTYDNHSREYCAMEYRRRLDKLVKEYEETHNN